MSGAGAIRGRVVIDRAFQWELFLAGGEWKGYRLFVAAMVAMPFLVAIQFHAWGVGILGGLAIDLFAAGVAVLNILGTFSSRRHKLGPDGRVLDVAFADDGMETRSGTGREVRIPWSAIGPTREAAQGFLIQTGEAVQYFPFRAFAAADLPRLRALIAQRAAR